MWITALTGYEGFPSGNVLMIVAFSDAFFVAAHL